MRAAATATATQLQLFAPPEIIPQGGGAYLVRPGKPRREVTPAQFAAAVGLHVNTIYVAIETGRIRRVRRTGRRKLLIDAAEIKAWEDAGRAEFEQIPNLKSAI